MRNKMNTVDVLDCGEISCEYCSKDKCIYMTDNNEVESDGEEIQS